MLGVDATQDPSPWAMVPGGRALGPAHAPSWPPGHGPLPHKGALIQEAPGARVRERAEPGVWTVSVYYHVDTDTALPDRPHDAGEGCACAAATAGLGANSAT